MVHQELNQCLERSVVDNMFLGRYPKKSFGIVDEGRMKKETANLFRQLGITANLTQPMKKCLCPSGRCVRLQKLFPIIPK